MVDVNDSIVAEVLPPVLVPTGTADEDMGETPKAFPLMHRTQMILALNSQRRDTSLMSASAFYRILTSVVLNIDHVIGLVTDSAGRNLTN